MDQPFRAARQVLNQRPNGLWEPAQPASRRKPVPEIEFENAEAFIHAVLTEDLIGQLKSGVAKSESGRTTVRVDGFRGQIDCDQAGYTVRFAGLETNTEMRIARVSTPAGEGC